MNFTFTTLVRNGLVVALRTLIFVIVACLSLNAWSAVNPVTSNPAKAHNLRSNLVLPEYRMEPDATRVERAIFRTEYKKVEIDYSTVLENARYRFSVSRSSRGSGYINLTNQLANGTLTFSNNAGLGDGIASDGEGGSMDLPGIAIDIFNISDVNGTDVGRIDWEDNSFFFSSDSTYSGLTYFDDTNKGTKGMVIKSRDGSEFQINGFTYYNWGETESTTITVRGFRNNVETVFYNFEGYNVNFDPIEVALHSGFDNVDEVRIYIFSGGHLGDQSESNHAINDIQIADVPLPSPVITSHPPNRTICNGGNTTFPVTATNATSYQWQENSGAGFTDLAEGGVYSGTNTATLAITGATPAMNGYQYRCRAINTGGSNTSNSATLTVITISLSGSHENVSAGGGNDGEATVIASGGIMPYTYSWGPSGGTGATATGLSAGDYTVTVTDFIGCSATYEFTILEPPTLTNIGGPMHFTENGAAVRIVAAGTMLTDEEDITGMALVLDAAPNGSDETIEYDESLNGSSSLASLGLAGGYNSGARTFEVSGTASPTVYQGVLRAMVYHNASEAPETTARALVVSATNMQGLTEHVTTTINVTAVNDAPEATNQTQSKAAMESGGAVALDDIVVTDVDGAETITATLKLSNPAAGMLTTGTYGSATSTFNAGTGTWAVTGPVADVNAALAAVAFTPSADNDQNFTITTRIRDAADTGPADGIISFTVTPVNDAPTATNLTQSKAATEGGSAVALDDIVVTDVDAGETVTATMSLSNAAAGSLSTGTYGSGPATSTFDAGTGLWTVIGSVADVNAALSAVAFSPSANNDQNFTITTRIRDAANTGPADGTITVTVTPVNDAPTATNQTQSKTATEGGGAVALDDIVVTDVDAGETVTATFTLSNAAAGSLSTGTFGSVTSTFGTGVWTAAGSVADVNAALAAVAFTPSADNDQPFAITTRIRDAADTGPADGIISFTITAVNDAPVTTAPAAIAVNEDISAALTGISFADVDAGSGVITVTLSVPSGALSAAGGAGVAVSGTSSALELSGTIADINAFIAASNVAYTTALNATANVTLTVGINDNGNTGTGGALGDSGMVTLQVTAVNDAPVITAPATIGVDEDVTAALTGISFADADAGSGNITATLSVPSGSLSATSGSGVTVGGTASALTLIGTVANINAFIDGGKVTYTSAANASGEVVLTASINDNGNTGAGESQSASETITLQVAAVNDAPSATNLTQNQSFTEDSGNLGLDDIVVTDPDAGETITATLTISNASAGSLTTGTYGSATSTYTLGTWTITGSVNDVNAALAALVFSPAANWDKDFTITTRIRDAGAIGPADGAISVTVTPVNDAPVIAGTSAGQTVNDNATLSPFLALAITDVDSPAQTQAVSVVLDDAAKGSFSTLNGFIDASGGVYAFSGTASAAQSAIRGLVFTPAANRVARGLTETTTFTISVNDGIAATVIDNTTTVVATSVNDAPTATKLTQAKTAAEGGSAVALDDIVVTDGDAGEVITATLTMSDPAAGSLSTGTFGSATSTYNAGTGEWAVAGSVADVNAALAAVAFTPSADNDQNFAIATRIRDAADTGPADGTISVTVTAVNDAPTIMGTPDVAVNQDATYSFVPVAGDIDGDVLTFSITNQPAWAEFDPATGKLSGTPGNADVGVTTGIVITVSDGMAGASLPAFDLEVLNVNDAPTLTGTPDVAVNQDAAYSFVPVAQDVDGDALAFSITNQPAWASFDASTGELSGTPGNADVGTTTGIIIAVSDGTAGASLSAFDLEVLNVNDAPTITGTPDVTVNQDAAYSFVPVAGDIDGDALTYSIANQPTWAAFNTATGELFGTPDNGDVGVTKGIVIAVSDGTASASLLAFNLQVVNVNDAPTISGTPAISVNQDAAYSFIPTGDDIDAGTVLEFSITNKPDWASFDTATGELSGTPGNADVGSTMDIVITVSDGILTASLPAFDLEVINVNDAPTITGTPDISVNQDAAYSFIPAGNDIDAGTVLEYSIINKPDWADFDPATGKLSGTPGNDAVGTTSGIVITVSDGTLVGSLPAFDLEVINVNDAPTISGTPATTVNQDAPYSFTPIGDDIDGDALTHSIVNKPNWADFNTVTGELSGTPGNADVGITTGIVITVSDGPESASLPAFDLEVLNVNDAPTISGTPATTVNQDAPYSFTPIGDDIDGDALTYSIVNKPSWASFNTGTGELSGTLGNADVGTTLGIVITVSDGPENVSLPAFDLEVLNVNDAPTISGTPATTVNQDADYSFTPTGNDIDGDALTYSIANKPSWASFNTGTGELSGTPSNDDVGMNTGIVITVSDGTLVASLPAFDLEVTTEVITGITFVDGSFVYDGTAKALHIDGNLPAGVTVTYANNSRTDTGTQEAMATMEGPGYTPLVLTADLTITPATITGITLEDGSFVYDGTAKALAIDGTLPSGTAVSYANNNRTAVGTQEVIATVSGDNHETLVLTADLTITQAVRSITFLALPEKVYGDADFGAGAMASSGETVSYASSDAGVVEVTTDGQLRITGAGQATITATVPDNGNYGNRPVVTQVLTVRKAEQTITLTAPAEVDRGAGTVQLDVSASSGLPVVLTLDDPEVATLSGSALNILRLGTVRVTATQTGDDNYEAADPVTVTVRVVDPTSDMPVRIHKAVSPNGDGINEYLIIEAIKDYPENRVRIFNRNGTVVWEASGYDNNRVAFRGIGTGRNNVSAGTYFYIAEIRVDGEWKYEKGWFVLRY